MEIDVSSIKRNPGAVINVRLNASLPLNEIEGEEIVIVSPVTADFKLTNTGDLILVDGAIQVEASLHCSRCLTKFTQVLTIPFHETYQEKSKATSAEMEGNSGAGINIFHGDTIKLAAAAWENIIAALPMKALCNKNCRGLCSLCGQDLNSEQCICKKEKIDPRLAVLRKLIKD